MHVSFVKARHNFGTNIQTKTINIFQQKTYGEKIKKDKKLEQNELDELAKKTKLMEQTMEKQKKMRKKHRESILKQNKSLDLATLPNVFAFVIKIVAKRI